jgi:hypothetical protein
MAVNWSAGVAYFINNSQWYSVDLRTGTRLFTGSDFSGGTGGSACQFTGLAVSEAANIFYLAGTCGGGAGTVAIFDGKSNAPLAQTALGAADAIGRLAFNPASNKLYAEKHTTTNPNLPATPGVNIYDGASLGLAGSMGEVFPMAFNAALNLIYFNGGGEFSAYDGETGNRIYSVPNPHGVFTAFSSIDVNQATGNIYLTNTEVNGSVDPGVPLSGQLTGVVDVFRQDPLFILGGKVLNGTAGVPGADITIAAAPGNSIGAGSQVRVLTDANGVFRAAQRVHAGTYIVSPTIVVACGGKFTCLPASQTVTVTSADVTNIAITATPNFDIAGKVVDPGGSPLRNITVSIQGIPAALAGFVAPSTVSTADGTFVLHYLPSGTYTLTAQGVPYGFTSQTVTIGSADVSGVVFTGALPVAITSYTIAPYSTVGPGVATTGTITLNQPAPSGGLSVTLTASNNAARTAGAVTVPQGQSSASFTIQGNSVSSATAVTLTASCQGPLAPAQTSATDSLTVAPADRLRVSSATWSKSTQVFTVNATSSSAQSIISVLNANGNAPLGTMTNQGGGNYSFQTTIASIASVNLKSNLGGSTGQGVSVVP